MLVPKQHGAWAMLIIPFWLGAAAGGLSWLHAPLFVGWLALYLAAYPLLMAVKTKRKNDYMRWFWRYASAAAVMLAVVLVFQWPILYFGAAMIPFFLVNVYFAKRKDERALANDIAAIASFCVGGLASFYLGRGELTRHAWELYLYCFFFFIGSTFYVKTMIREKNNPAYKWVSWGYHALLLFVPIAAGSPLLALAYAPSAVRAVYLYGKQVSIIKVGVLEIANSVFFALVMLIGIITC